jgi:SpoVK/Ycf46/Vps4 family AAA+-type ATPase
MSDTGEDRLAQLFADDFEDYPPVNEGARLNENEPAPTGRKLLGDTVSQWTIAGNGRFLAVGKTRPALESGVYMPFVTASGATGFELMNINSDGIYALPDMATETVLREVETFWNNEELYRKHHLLYKRGILLWGPPGSGKTITVKLLMKEIIKRQGIVLVVQNVSLALSVLKEFRAIEPTRSIILVLEDIDEIISHNGESSVLSLLDGEHNLDNVLNLATTNYPELLGARIINRPSRFDRRVFVDMPNEGARTTYFTKATHDAIGAEDLAKWVIDTEGMSIAHMRELVAAVFCLGQQYTDVIERLKAMAIRPKAKEDGFKSQAIGLMKSAAKSRW